MSNQIQDSENITDIEQYEGLFKEPKETLKLVHDIRKFEIELYWKRTTFFWTIIAAITAGYFTVYSKLSSGDINSYKIVFALCCLGLLFSIGWYFVNRGSKFWQMNWEKHLECLEDKAGGPLYKTIIDRGFYQARFRNLLAPYPFSVSKINQVLNLVMIFFWMLVIFDFSHSYLDFKPCSLSAYFSFYSYFSLLTLVAIWSMFMYTQTGTDNYLKRKKKRKKTAINFERRGLG